MKKGSILLISLIGLLATTACSRPAVWEAVHVQTIPGFDVPECALPDVEENFLYISNIESDPGEYWDDDGRGSLAVLNSTNLSSAPVEIRSNEPLLHSPKGMCILGDWIYFTDNSRVMRTGRFVNRQRETKVEVVAGGFTKANDLATDGTSVWVSDVAEGKIIRLSENGDKFEIKSPASVNGITFHGKKMYAVSWDLHEIYRVDPKGKRAPKAFGLASYFANLDGIEVLDDGSFLVSDFKGNQVVHISANRKQLVKLIELTSPADIGFDRKNNLLYVPQFMKDRVAIYQLRQK